MSSSYKLQGLYLFCRSNLLSVPTTFSTAPVLSLAHASLLVIARVTESKRKVKTGKEMVARGRGREIQGAPQGAYTKAESGAEQSAERGKGCMAGELGKVQAQREQIWWAGEWRAGGRCRES